MQATTALPPGYRQEATLEPLSNRAFLAGTAVSAIALFIGVGFLLVRFADFLRPAALDGMRLRDLLITRPGGQPSLVLPFRLLADAAIAQVLVVVAHELVHGLFIWWFARRRPRFGIKGLLPYAAAPAGVYFPRNQFLAVGIAPLVLLTSVGLLLMVVAPAGVVPILLMFCAMNVSGAAGDLLIVAWLLSCASDTLMEDRDTGMIVYGPDSPGPPITSGPR